MNKKLVASLLAAVLFIQSSALAATNVQNSTMNENTAPSSKQSAAQDTNKENDGRAVLTLDEAIEKGLKNNILFQQVQNKADIAALVKDNSTTVRTDLSNAADDIYAAENALADGRDQIEEGESSLEDAKMLLDEGKFPIKITCGTIVELLKGSPAEQAKFQYLMKQLDCTATTVLAEQGSSIAEFCQGKSKDPRIQYIGTTMASLGYDETNIKLEIKGMLKKESNKLSAGQSNYNEGVQEYATGQAKYQASLKYALSSVSNKLSTSTISSLEAKPLGDLIVKMSEKQNEVTKYSVDIYRNQVALLIEKNYFEALKQQELLKVKEKAEERGRVQYEMAKAAYEVGMKSRDDMNIAKTYYDSTIMNTALQEKEYATAMLELKKTLNMKQSDDFVLEAVEPDTSEVFDLNKGIETGLNARLEIKMAKAQKDIYGYLMTAVNDSGYSSTSNQYKEVKLLQKQADLAYEDQKAEVERSIRESYQAVQATKKLADTAIDLRANAEATVESAKLKYEAGYGYSSALLANLNLQQMAGTYVEVIAAEENLANIEEKQIEAMNGYNLARLKYLNDTGVLPYK